MNLETKITIYKFTPQLFTLTRNHGSPSGGRLVATGDGDSRDSPFFSHTHVRAYKAGVSSCDTFPLPSTLIGPLAW